MSWTRSLVVVGLIAGIIVIGASAPVHAENQPDTAIRVRTALVSAAPEHREILLYGVTRATDRAELSFTVGGRLRSRTVNIGDRVVAGQVLAHVDSSGFENGFRAAAASVNDLQGQLAQVGRDLARVERLGESQSVSLSELERVRTQESSLRAALSAASANATEASRQRRETSLTAPFDGVITAVYLEAGESAAPGRPVVQITGAGALEVALEVPERVWAGLQDGATASVELPAFDRQVAGRVSQVGQNTGRGGLFPVIISLDEGNIAAGLTAEVTLPVPVREKLAVPVRAVVDPTGSQAIVYRITDGKAEAVPVRTGTLLGTDVSVTGELQTRDEVVVSGLGRLLDGDVVNVLQ